LTPQVLDRYREMLGPAFVKQLARTWLETSPTLAETVINALRSGQFDDARRAAHTLKSASAILGAHALAAMCQQIEEHTAAGQVTKEWGVQRLDAFEEAWSLTVPAVTKLTNPD
jgi:HPt (histidine-containing phosphotransfer) domain-containing protein